MSNKVEKGKDISVLVEQAFPTCILVSFQHGDKTFRGVLLDESSQTVIRASPSDVLSETDSPANLGLTTARATTCQRSSGRVGTRSSVMMLDDSMGSNERVTPVHKIRGLVESLNQKSRRLSPKAQSSRESSSTKSPTLKQAEAAQPLKRKQTNSMKRKRDGKSTDQTPDSSFKPAKARSMEKVVATDASSSDIKCEQVLTVQNGLSSPSTVLSGISPLFPVLKLKKTSAFDNSYVAVTMFNSVEDKGTHELGLSGEMATKPATSTSSDAVIHEHNTRFKARKIGKQSHSAPSRSEINFNETKHCVSLRNEESFPEVFTQRSNHVTNIRTQTKRSNSKLLQGSSTLRRQLHSSKPHHHSQSMRVGDIVWGKVHGHPWWPGRVLGILCHGSESDGTCQVVKVSWYGSTTTSDISCGSLVTFEENFKHMFKKQKKGAYRLAVRQAQHDLELTMNGTQVMLV